MTRRKSWLVVVLFGFFCLPQIALAHARLHLFPELISPTQAGQNFTVQVYSDCADSCNAFSGDIEVPDFVTVTGISINDSIIDFWVAPPAFSEIDDQISFDGAIANEGFAGQNGLLFSIAFSVDDIRSDFLEWKQGAVLAGDGLGTALLTKMNSALITPQPQLIAPSDTIDTQVQELAADAQNLAQARDDSCQSFQGAIDQCNQTLTQALDQVKALQEQVFILETENNRLMALLSRQSTGQQIPWWLWVVLFVSLFGNLALLLVWPNDNHSLSTRKSS